MKLLSILFLILSLTTVHAEPLRLIVSAAVGNSLDVVVRNFAPLLSKEINQEVMIDNEPKAGGIVATVSLIKTTSPNDTMLISTVSIIANYYLNNDVHYNFTDFTKLSGLVSSEFILGSSKYNTFNEFIKAAKTGQLNYASIGAGGISTLGAIKLGKTYNFKSTMIPFRTSAEATNDVLSGRVDFYMLTPSFAKGFVEQNKMKTFKEFTFSSWVASYVSNNMTPERRLFLTNAIKKVVESDEFKKSLLSDYTPMSIQGEKLEDLFTKTQLEIKDLIEK
jgi:tripartite-type tricarboxylate transporter receptor subunit TctC